MSAAVAAEPVPLSTDTQGVLRMAGTRIPLDTVLIAYRRGDSPEQIVQDYPTLDVGDVYAVIAYYLRHRDEVESYLERRQNSARKVREKYEGIFPANGIRERLESRRT